VQVFTARTPTTTSPVTPRTRSTAPGLVKVAAVTARARRPTSPTRDKPLTSTLASATGASAAAAAPSTGERRASLGTVPDYAFAGPGVRNHGHDSGSPAEKAGLKEGDVLDPTRRHGHRIDARFLRNVEALRAGHDGPP
jgi:hypothetical protein